MNPGPGNESKLAVSAERMKRHKFVWPLGALAVSVVALAGFLGAFEDLRAWSEARLHPNKAEYERIASLELGIRPTVFDKMFDPQKIVDLCGLEQPCTNPKPTHLQMYVSEKPNLVVRAVFENDQLVMYLVTLKSGEITPPMSWLGNELGHLGDVSMQDALKNVPAGLNRNISFLDPAGGKGKVFSTVVSTGMSGRYPGLVFASDPRGGSGSRSGLDLKHGELIRRALDEGRRPAPSDVAAFNQGSAPNTYGIFQESGRMGQFFKDPANVAYTVLAGSPG